MSLLIDPRLVLVLVDVAGWFLERIDEGVKEGLVDRIAFLVLGAKFCGIPVITWSSRRRTGVACMPAWLMWW